MGTADTRREPDVGSQAKGGAQGVPRSSGAGVAGVRVAVSGPQRSRGPWAHTQAARKDPFQGGREGAAERVAPATLSQFMGPGTTGRFQATAPLR